MNLNNINYINSPADALYVSEFINELPVGILNKRETGCGATHLVLTNSLNTIVTVPTIELIKNKTAQLKDVFGVYNNVKLSELQKYINSLNDRPIKIMVTYDSLSKIIKWFKDLNLSISDFRVIVDEYHLLLSNYSFRNSAIRSLLKITSELTSLYNNVTYLSATPIINEYTPVELINIPINEIVWTNTVKVKPFRIKTNKPLNAVSNIIRKHLVEGHTLLNQDDKEGAKELYIFLNSVNAIKDIIDDLNLDNSNVKVVCSETNANKEKLDTIKISSALDVNKPITFITSKAFMGSDFYSTSGLIIIVSCNTKKSTMLDIATDITQISGRIRNKDNKFKNVLLHIYNTSVSDMTKEEWVNEVETRKRESLSEIELFNQASDNVKQGLKLRFQLELEERYSYYDEINNCMVFDDFKLKSQMFNFNIINEVYTNGLSIREAYAKNGFDVNSNQVYIKLNEEFVVNTTKRSFKDIAKKYIELIKNNNLEQSIKLEQEEPLLKLVKDRLGITAFTTFNYSQVQLKKAVYNNSEEVNNALKSLIIDKFKLGEFYSLAEIKIFLKECYKLLMLERVAKASKISEYFNIIETSKRINSKKFDGYLLSSLKY